MTALVPQKKKRKKLSRRERIEREDKREISKIGWKSKHMVGRPMNHDEKETGEMAPAGFQIEDPSWQICKDGSERLQLFHGNRLEALDAGEGNEVDNIIRKWVDESGEYKFMLQELQQTGFKIVEHGENGVLVEKETTIAEAYVERLEVTGRVGPTKFSDDYPEVFWKREIARRMEHENPTKGWRDTDGQRDRNESPSLAPKDPEDVSWGDDPMGDPYGQGVQTVVVDGVTMWFHERPVYGCVRLEDGTYAEMKVGREQVARPFYDLIFPERFEVMRTSKDRDTGESFQVKIGGWDVLDDKKQVIEGLNASSFKGIWDQLSEIKRRVDELDKAEIRGTGYLPWGEPFVKMIVEIPEELKNSAGILMMIGKYSAAKYFSFGVTGPAVPALKDEFEKSCRKARGVHTAPVKDQRLEQLKIRANRKTKQELAKVTTYTVNGPVGQPGPAIPITGVCEICGRQISAKRMYALKELLKDAPDFTTSLDIERFMRRCVRLEEVSDGERRYKRTIYCDKSDVIALSVSK